MPCLRTSYEKQECRDVAIVADPEPQMLLVYVCMFLITFHVSETHNEPFDFEGGFGGVRQRAALIKFEFILPAFNSLLWVMRPMVRRSLS